MIKKIATYIPSVALPMLLNFVLAYLYADLLTPEEYGIFSIYLNTISFVYAIVLSFLQSASYRFFSTEEGRDKEVYLSTYIIANFIISAIAAILLLCVNLFLRFNWWVIAISIFANALYQFFVNLCRLEDKVKLFTMLRVFTVAWSILVLLGIKFLGQTVSYVTPLIVFYGTYLICVAVELIKAAPQIHISKVSWKLFKHSFYYGMPMMGYNIVGLMLASCDQYLILYFKGSTENGYYSLGYRLVDAIIVNCTSVIFLVVTPILMRKYDDHKEKECENLITAELNLNFWITIPIATAIIVYAQDLINLFFPAYQGAANIVRWVAVSGIFHGISCIVCKGLELPRETKKEFYLLILATAINCIYNLIFIPLYGTMAAAHSSIIAYTLYSILLVICAKKYLTIRIDLKYLLRVSAITIITLLAAVVMKYCITMNGWTILAVQVIILVVVYLGLSFVLKMFRGFELKE